MRDQKEKKGFSNPEEFNKHLQYTFPTTWIILGAVIVLLGGFFVWSFIFKLQVKITGKAKVFENKVTLTIEESQKQSLAVGQKVYIADKVGEIIAINDGEPVVSSFDLADNDYTYTIVLKEMHPIDFLFN